MSQNKSKTIVTHKHSNNTLTTLQHCWYRAANLTRIRESILVMIHKSSTRENHLLSLNHTVIVRVEIKFDSHKLEQNCTPLIWKHKPWNLKGLCTPVYWQQERFNQNTRPILLHTCMHNPNSAWLIFVLDLLTMLATLLQCCDDTYKKTSQGVICYN